MSDVIQAQFNEYLINDGRANGTIDSYTRDVKQFLNYLKQLKLPFEGEIPRSAILSYRDKLIMENARPTTINKKVNSLLVFNRFLIEKSYMNKNVVHTKRDKIRTAHGSDQQVTILSDNEISRLLSFIKDSSRVTIRNRLIVYLLLYTGVRVSELVNIKLHNIDSVSSYLTVDFGKGGVMREIPLKNEVLDLIEQYRTTERAKSPFNKSPFLLLSQRSGKMHRDAISRALHSIGNHLKIHLHCHLFRHTTFSLLIKKGVPISTVSKLAGHSNINTTMKFYISTSREDKRSAIDLL